MKNSLKSQLFEAIKSVYPRVYHLETVEALAHEEGYKISNAERRLRELMKAGAIESVRSQKGAIVGYRLKTHETIKRAEHQNSLQDALFRIKRIF